MPTNIKYDDNPKNDTIAIPIGGYGIVMVNVISNITKSRH